MMVRSVTALPSTHSWPRQRIPWLSRGRLLLGQSLSPTHALDQLLPPEEESGSYFVPDGRLT
jgi:hypothetical protein